MPVKRERMKTCHKKLTILSSDHFSGMPELSQPTRRQARCLPHFGKTLSELCCTQPSGAEGSHKLYRRAPIRFQSGGVAHKLFFLAYGNPVLGGVQDLKKMNGTAPKVISYGVSRNGFASPFSRAS